MKPKLSDVEKIRRLPWIILGSLTNSVFCALTFVGSVFILFLNELGLDKTRIGFLISLMPFCQVISLFITGIIERIGIKRIFLWFWGLRKAIMALLLVTPFILARWGTNAAFFWVAGTLFLFSLCRAVAETAIWTWTQEFVPNRIRGKFGAVNTIFSTITTFVTVMAAGFVIGNFTGLRRFIILIAVGIVAGFLSLLFHFFVPGGQPVPKEQAVSFGFKEMFRSLKDRNYLLFLIGLGLATMVLGSFGSFVPLFMKQQVGLLPGHVVWLDLGAYFGSIFSCFLWGWASDRYGSKPVMLCNLILALLLPLLWFAMPRFHPWNNYAALSIALLFGVINVGWCLSFSRYLFNCAVPPEKNTNYMAVFYAWLGFFGGVGPLISGRFLDFCAPIDISFWIFHIDAYTPFFALGLLGFIIAILILARVSSDSSIATPYFVKMFFQGNVFLALGSLLRYHWARDESNRVVTTQRLGQAKTLLSANELIEALDDPSFNVRYEAIIAIANLPRHPRLVNALILVLGGNQPDLSLAAAWALGKLGDRGSIIALRETLLSEYRLLRACSARALATLGDSASIPFLLEKLKTEPDEHVRIAYACSLGALHADSALPDILQLLRQAEDTVSRRELSLAVARIVGAEHQYIRLSRRMNEEFDTTAAQSVLGFKRRFNLDRWENDQFKRQAEDCARDFADGDVKNAIPRLCALAQQFARRQKTTVAADMVLHDCIAALADSGVCRPEYLILLLHTLYFILHQPLER